jgi:hypothetical protein
MALVLAASSNVWSCFSSLAGGFQPDSCVL